MLVRTDKKVDGSVEVTDPDLGGAGVEVERALFVDFRWKIGGGMISTQISGARSKTVSWATFSVRPGASQATSTALTPPAVETGHSDKVGPLGRSSRERAQICAWRWPWSGAGGGLMRMWPY